MKTLKTAHFVPVASTTLGIPTPISINAVLFTLPLIYSAESLVTALRKYAKTGIKVHRSYTPTKMLAAASQITGKAYKRGEYRKAASDVSKWVKVAKTTGGPKIVGTVPVVA